MHAVGIVDLTGPGLPRGGLTVDVAGFKSDSVDERVRLVRSEAGARFERLELNVVVQRVVVIDDAESAAGEMAATWPALSVRKVLDTPYLLSGTVGEMAAALRARRERWGISYVVTHEPFRDALAPLVAKLAAT